jgi:hypothetical protein
MERSNNTAARRLPLAAAFMVAVLLTWVATTLIPTTDDLLGWGVRGALFVGLCWAVR